jgi:peptidoglycan-N-acetylglucosamine deacetylase
MLNTKNIALWGSVGLALAIVIATIQRVDRPLPLSPLRFAFMDSTAPEARAALAKHVQDLDGVIGEWLNVDDQGKVSENEDADQDDGNPSATLKFIRSSRRPLTVLALVSDQPGRTRAFLHLDDPDFRLRLKRQLIGEVKKFGFDGLLIDFDDPREANETGLLQLIEELHSSLSRLGKKIGVVLPGEWPVDYKGFGAVSDLVVVELYNEGRSRPGPLAANDWWRQVITARTEDIARDKLIFSFASTGRDWTPLAENGTSQSVSFGALMLIAATQHVPIEFDRASGNPHFSYLDSSGFGHDIWFLDAATAFNQLTGIVRELPKGVALWELGADDESLWRIFKYVGRRTAFDFKDIENVASDYIMARIGDGEIYRFLSRARPGRRTLEINELGGIEQESFDALPRPWEIGVSGVARGSIALTFDDGPDPEYTQAILDILKRENVKATFFVTGVQSIKHLGTIRRIAKEGHELGNHTFTHPNLTKLPDFLVRLEINATQRLIQVLTGKTMTLIRPPYSADDMGDTIEEAHVVELVSQLGYITVGANLNPEDWRGISAQEIVDRVLSKADDGDGSVIELHDAGGDRSQTVAALPILIEALRNRGFNFITASQLAGSVPESGAIVAKDPWLPVAEVGVEGISLEDKIFSVLFWTCLVLSGLRFVLLLVSALCERASRRPLPLYEPPVSVLIPAYNEEKVVVQTIELVLRSNYRQLAEVIVVDDGSADGTASTVERAFKDEPRVRLFQRPNRGKAEALNYAVAQMRTEIAVMIDADTCLHPHAIGSLARHFSDARIGAVAGNAKVGNRKNLLTNLQALEYITSQNLERAGLAKLDAITVVPGAIGAWRREALLKAGGFNPTTLAEDCDLTFCLHRLGYRIVHDMKAIAWTEAPESWRAFGRQRFRWIFGTLQAAYRHSDAMLQPKLGGFALITLPSVVLFSVVLPLISPILDFVLLIAICGGITSVLMHPETYSLQPTLWAVGAYTFVFLVDVFAAVLAFALEPGEQKRLLAYLPIQRVCYRQVLYVIIIRALLACLRGNAQGWNKLVRVGSVSCETVS